MAKIRKALPRFQTEEEEAAYWDSHSPLEHFEESDFKPLTARRAKDTPVTIRLDSESRKILDQVARAHRVGPSTLARIFIIKALEQWKQKQQISLTLEDATQILAKPVPEELRQEMQKVFTESKAGNILLLHEAEVERLGKLLVRTWFEAAGYRITSDSESQNNTEKKAITATV